MTPTSTIEVPATKFPARVSLLAACMMHEEGYYSTESRAFRNKNPGNIEELGKPGVFVIFPSIQQGYEALCHDIMVNRGRKLRDFISKYAPPNENNTSEYLENVSIRSGIGEDDEI